MNLDPKALDPRVLALYGRARETTNRDDVIAAIRAGLRARSGKSWSVTGGRGTAWGWIRIRSPKARAANEWGDMTDAERAELGDLLGFGRPVHGQGESIAASSDHYREYLFRSGGLPPTVVARPYWD